MNAWQCTVTVLGSCPPCRQLESIAARVAEQQRAAQESERNLARRLRQAESAQAAATEAERHSFSQAQRAEVAASLAKQALLKAQAGLQENKTKLHLEQQKTAELQVSCKARLKPALPALERQNLSCAYLAHHELESISITIAIVVIMVLSLFCQVVSNTTLHCKSALNHSIQRQTDSQPRLHTAENCS